MMQNKTEPVIGLTGSIACGKSTVSRILKEKGCRIVDADAICDRLFETGSPLLEKIQKEFGEGFLNSDGSYNRLKMGDLIAKNPGAREKLNALVHPLVFDEVMKQIGEEKGKGLVIYDCPLLFEGKYRPKMDGVLVIRTDKETAIARMMLRDQFTEEQARARYAMQMPIDEKVRLADWVIDNNLGIEELEEAVSSWLEQLFG